MRGATCSIGSLPAYQSFELLVTDKIGKNAKAGEQVTLTVTVQGAAEPPSSTTLSPAEAGVSTVVTQQNSPNPSTSGTLPTTAPLPGTTVTPGSLASLFPLVTPQSTPAATPHRRPKHKVTRVTTTASSLPLDSRLIGGQLAGLAVLAAAITMVVARLSLRTPQPATSAGQAVAAAPPSPLTDSPAVTEATSPAAPETPVTPDTPAAPETPATPDTPAGADTPAAPDTPAEAEPVAEKSAPRTPPASPQAATNP